MAKDVTIKLSDETARWARNKAAEADISLSELVERILQEEMLRTDPYWKAFDEWKTDRPLAAQGVPGRLTRDIDRTFRRRGSVLAGLDTPFTDDETTS